MSSGKESRLSARVLLCALAGLLVSVPAHAQRYALVIGVGEGDAADEPLQHAASDARRVTQALTSVGGFEPENVVTLLEGTAPELTRALATVSARTSPDATLFVFYSGHADEAALHLQGTRLPLADLKAAVARSPARAKVLIIDACRSGSLTRVKGGRRAPGFDVTFTGAGSSEGLAILTSSASGEDSQESDSLQASFFTHYFTSALLGAADADRNGEVTLSEAFAYTRERTLKATAVTSAGPQHPTFENQLKGRDELVLSRPGQLGRKQGQLLLAEPGWYVVSRPDDGAVIAEVLGDAPGASLTLEAGRYRVVRREPASLQSGDIDVPAGARATLTALQLQRMPYARVVRKGGTDRVSAWSVFAAAGARGALTGLGLSLGAEAGTRVELPAVALELRLSFGRSGASNERLGITTDELQGTVSVWKAIDVGAVTLALGTAAGGAVLWQRFEQKKPSDADPRLTGAFVVAPLAMVQLPVGPLHLRVDGGPVIYVMKVGNTAAEQSLTALVTWRVNAGLGVEF